MEEKKPAAYVPPSKRGIVGVVGEVMPPKFKQKAPQPPSGGSQLNDKEKKIRTVKKVTTTYLINSKRKNLDRKYLYNMCFLCRNWSK